MQANKMSSFRKMFPKNAPMSPMSITGPVNTKTCPIGQTLSWYLNETITKLLRNADCYEPLNHTLTIGWAGAVRTSNTCVTRVTTLTECLATFRICTNWADVWIWLNKRENEKFSLLLHLDKKVSDFNFSTNVMLIFL